MNSNTNVLIKKNNIESNTVNCNEGLKKVNEDINFQLELIRLEMEYKKQIAKYKSNPFL